MEKVQFKNKSILNEEHSGFAITLEVIATLVMLCIFLNLTLYILRVMNVQRYMNTVMTATATQASRWGGINSNAYHNNVSSTPLLVSAQYQLTYVANGFNAVIGGSPDKISNNGDKITIWIDYTLPSVFQTSGMSKVSGVNESHDMYDKTKIMRISVTVNSIMEAGKLL